jgi:hypothetical protein
MQLVQRLQHDRTLPDIVREAASKWSGLFARLTLIFRLVEVAERQIAGEVLEQRDIVGIRSETAMKAATLIRKVVLPNLLRLGFETLPDGKEQANARWIAEHILANKLPHITARDVGRAFRPLRGQAPGDCREHGRSHPCRLDVADRGQGGWHPLEDQPDRS